MMDLAERGLGLPARSRRRSALAKLSAMMAVAVTEPADSEPNPPTRRKMTPSHITAWRNRFGADTVGRLPKVVSSRQAINRALPNRLRAAGGHFLKKAVQLDHHCGVVLAVCCQLPSKAGPLLGRQFLRPAKRLLQERRGDLPV